MYKSTDTGTDLPIGLTVGAGAPMVTDTGVLSGFPASVGVLKLTGTTVLTGLRASASASKVTEIDVRTGLVVSAGVHMPIGTVALIASACIPKLTDADVPIGI